MAGKFVLHAGIHNGTFMSRDSDTNSFDTRDNAAKWLDESEQCRLSIGYIIWFATLTHPDGTIEKLRKGNCNYNNERSFSDMISEKDVLTTEKTRQAEIKT